MTSEHLELGLTDEEMPYFETGKDDEAIRVVFRAIADAATAKAAYAIVEWLTAKWKDDCLDEMDKAPALEAALEAQGIQKPEGG